MSRPLKDSNDFITEGLQQVIDRMQDGKLSQDEVREVAYQWCIKNYQHHIDLANSLSLIPNRLILFALLFIEHPLIVSPGRGIKWGFLKCTAEIMNIQIHEIAVEIPINNSIHSIHSPSENRFNSQVVERMERIEQPRRENG